MAPLLISVGEASGDRQAAAVLRALGGSHRVVGKVGPELIEAGAEELLGIEGHFGFSQPVAMLRELRDGRRKLLEFARDAGVKRALLVDYSGFHIPLGRALREQGVHVVGFIPPKLWAWGGWRLAKARQAYDELFTILPFEADWWREKGIPATYVGNPIADQTPAADSPADGPVALVPGSRPGEIQHVGPLIAEAARIMLRDDASLEFVVPRASTVTSEALASVFEGLPVRYAESMVEAVSCASVALVCNGTAALEVGLVGTPQVITYRTGRLHWAIGRTLVRLELASPCNLVLTRAGEPQGWPEVFQGDASPEHLAAMASSLRSDSAARSDQFRASEALRRLMGAGVGIEAVAKAWAP